MTEMKIVREYALWFAIVAVLIALAVVSFVCVGADSNFGVAASIVAIIMLLVGIYKIFVED